MFFNSLDFAIFLPIVFVLYWLIPKKKINSQNLFIVAVSYIFYSWWNWRFLLLILISTIVDYIIGLALTKQSIPGKRKTLLITSLVVNLGLLGFFKYFNFFVDSFTSAFSFFGKELSANSLNIILPVGISFYTFQTLSYTLDIYRNKLKPTNNFIAFAAFVSFFPQLVAGPIERATNFLPQFFTKRTFNYVQATNGLKQMLWGLFKKVVIADNCAEIVDYTFYHTDNLQGSILAVGAILFTIQLYADFSGYSDIAIGTARLFGFNLKQNFAFPLFSKSIAEFWRRWHISLSTWLRDYLYIPLGGNRGGSWQTMKNISLVFIFGSLWHGANWTFIVWGLINVAYFVTNIAFKNTYNTIKISSNLINTLINYGSILLTFCLTSLAFIVFRSENLNHAFNYFNQMFSSSLFSLPEFNQTSKIANTTLMVLLLLCIEWNGKNNLYAIEKFGFDWNRLLRWCFYSFIIFLIGMYMQTTFSPFIYFQF